MTSTMTHRDCHHPATKAARAKCRRNRASIAAANFVDQLVEENTAWQNEREALDKLIAEAHALADNPACTETMIHSANINADDTATELDFPFYGVRWYEIYIATLTDNIDTGHNYI